MLGSVLEEVEVVVVVGGDFSLQEHWHRQTDGEGEGSRQFMVR